MKKEVEDLNPALKPHFSDDPLPVHVYHVAVRGLVAVTGISVLGIIALSFEAKTSEGLISIASACIGGLVGIFSQRSNKP
ncbi:hypothetical protein KFZ76_08135 [Methylovulum psychrotolerans]|uniref:hypothetical protein n=1 Tax=Methylovulum psychrotolerans TaxID=1704499 RepID=UPI001BFF36F3|nr:hypothetical protein [Methylovulum psychrotolerans]MBT9097674.1 hypothetical protein [Methylovulum psychrotolerans]